MKYSLSFLLVCLIIYFSYSKNDINSARQVSFIDKPQYTLINKQLKPKKLLFQANKSNAYYSSNIQQINVQELHAVLVSSQDIDDRLNALRQLETEGSQEALDIIEKALAINNNQIHSGVIAALSSFQAKDVIHLLGQVVFSSTDQTLKLQAIDAILEKNTAAGHAILHFAASHDRDNVIRHYIASELANYSGLKVAHIESDNRPQEDYFSMLQNAFFQDSAQAIKGFQTVLTGAANDQLRKDAILALANRNEEQADLIIEQALADKSSAVRLLAIHVLANSSDNVLPLLGRVLLSETDEKIRAEVVKLIALESNPAKVEFLKLAMDDIDQKVSGLAKKYLQVSEGSVN